MPTTLSNPTPSPVKGTYGFRAAAWERARERGAKSCACGRENLSPTEAKRGQCWRCEDAADQVKQRCRGQCGQWVPRDELSPNLKYCKTCAAVHRSEQSAYVNRALPSGSEVSDDQLAADTTDLFSGEPAEPSLSDVIANLEAARARVEALDAMTAGEEPVEEAQAGTWDEDCKSWEFFCKGCGRTRPSSERVEAYVKRGCHIIETLELCRPCSSEVSVCARG